MAGFYFVSAHEAEAHCVKRHAVPKDCVALERHSCLRRFARAGYISAATHKKNLNGRSVERDRFSAFEFVLVIGVAFGWTILASLQWAMAGQAIGEIGTPDALSERSLYGVVVQELLLAPVAMAILYARGWRLKDFPLAPSSAGTFLGIAIAMIAYAAYGLFEQLAAGLFDAVKSGLDALDGYRPSSPLGVGAVILASLINPVFEEIFVCAYVIEALRSRFGETVAINVSVAIRASYHLYQGVPALPFHLAYGLMQAYVYTRFRRLWPLIVSHAILDFVAFIFMT